jgi:MoCo/4Fe-4S cofactor protein with predicted Tat translocation signal
MPPLMQNSLQDNEDKDLMTDYNDEPLNLAGIRKKLEAMGGKITWRSLDELAESEEFLRLLEDEFPDQTRSARGLDRRDFLKLMGASLGLAGLTACSPQPSHRLMPFVDPPEGFIPGEPRLYASAFELSGYARGVLVVSREGRPIKIEGNPRHPASLGATDAFTQASILDLYDPDRAQVISSRGRLRTRDAASQALAQAVSTERARGGSGLRLLTQTVTSPTLAGQIEELLEAFPQAQWHQYEAVNQDNALEAAEAGFGQPVEIHYDLSQAAVIVSLDCDFIMSEPGSVRYAHDFGQRRGSAEQPNRLYVIEAGFTNTGAAADHRLGVPPSQIEAYASRLASALGVQGLPQSDAAVQPPAGWIENLAADLEANPGAAVIMAGRRQPASIHMLAHAMNEALGSIGTTVIQTDPVQPTPVHQVQSLSALVRDLEAGSVGLLVILGGNPAYTAPIDLNFPSLIGRAGMSIYLGLQEDETALLCDWHYPAAHYLEMWSDTRAYDGTISIVQPLIEPLYGGMSPHELLEELLGRAGTSGYDVIRRHWQEAQGAGADQARFEQEWRQVLHDGLIEGSASEPGQASLLPGWQANLFRERSPGTAAVRAQQSQEMEIAFDVEPSLWDGRFANNAWLQELPRPLTKIVWDNAALISPSDAERLDVQNFDVVELAFQGRTIRAPIWVLPGQPAGVVTAYLGHGRSRGGKVLSGTGYNANVLRTTEALWFGSGLEVRPTGQTYRLATTQGHYSMEGRDLVLHGTVDHFREDPDLFHTDEHYADKPPSLYPEFPYEGHAWGMSINLSACTGCNACVVACQAENNIAVVGKEQVINSREMHWLRIDTYYEGSLDRPTIYHQPMLCVHCEEAPCEPVCPVAATVHSAEGINEMVYNRCIGTRYCSNNCPYKVRRFNFLDYAEHNIPLQMLHNPEVTVRKRGVMEKCTYCVQRVNKARIQAKKENRRVRDGEAVTACQQACPTNAIIFGDINDPESQVAQRKALPHDYSVLGHLGTQPRTTYLARLTNPNPQLGEEQEGG